MFIVSRDMDAAFKAIIHAFIHNGWNISEPLFYMFDDKLEILSYDGTPYSQTKERFLQGISVPRKLSLMRVFQDLEIAKKTIQRIIKIISAYGKDVFEIQDGFIQVTIPFEKKVMKNHGNINSDLSKNELFLINVIIIQKPSITLTEAAETMEVSKRTVSRIFAKLKNKGCIKRDGSNKRGTWKIVKFNLIKHDLLETGLPMSHAVIIVFARFIL